MTFRALLVFFFPRFLTSSKFVIVSEAGKEVLLDIDAFHLSIREIIIMAFECPHCGFRNNELQSAGVFNERGHTISLSIQGKEVKTINNFREQERERQRDIK